MLVEASRRHQSRLEEYNARGLFSTLSPENAIAIRRLKGYLQEITQKGAISAETASFAWKAWNDVRALMGSSLLIPNATPTSDEHLLYTWDRAEHHFEIEIIPDGIGEFFYMNRVNDSIWEEDYAIGTPIPSIVKSKLRIFQPL